MKDLPDGFAVVSVCASKCEHDAERVQSRTIEYAAFVVLSSSASSDTAWGRPLKETLHLPNSTGTYVLRVLIPPQRGAPNIVNGPRVVVRRNMPSGAKGDPGTPE